MNIHKMETEFSSSSSDDESALIKKAEPQDQKMWDIFQDPPAKKTTGSADLTRGMDIFLKSAKVFTYMVVFIIMLAGAVASKLSLVFMASQLSIRNISYCNDIDPQSTFNAVIDDTERIAWLWAIVFAFAFPELLTFYRSFRICFFKNVVVPSISEQLCITAFEILHCIGLGILCFLVLPEIDTVKGLMLTNCLSIIPAVLGFCNSLSQKKLLSLLLDTLAISAQVTGFVVWPLMSGDAQLWLIPVALILVSARWWENYASDQSFLVPMRWIARLKTKLMRSRYFIYLYLSPLKVFAFLFTGILMSLDKRNFSDHFTLFSAGWRNHTVTTYSVEYGQTLPEFTDTAANASTIVLITAAPLAICYTVLVQVLCAYTTYLAARFACKVKIQSISFAAPLSLTVPACISTVLAMAAARRDDVCAFHGFFPDYLFFNISPPAANATNIWEDFGWIWILWFLSQAWITKHIWTSNFNSGEATDILFVAPLYNGLIIDQSLTMNQRRDNLEGSITKEDITRSIGGDEDAEMADNPIDKIAKKNAKTDVTKWDRIPQVYICATMWHENKDEMMEFLKSILRLDEDQSARRLAMKYLQASRDDVDKEYYDLETHIFFDDAFMESKDCDDRDGMPINEYVRLLVNSLEESAREVYQVTMKIHSPTRTKTPYGGRLEWTLPGRTKIIAHLKHKDKIRRKKRWSQVMYMYYLLGFRIMQSNISEERKHEIAQNTYLLALDGDIDFQPNAVQLLLSRMKVDPYLGAACGRIHPVGTGPMVWYQTFEYAIGHWLQKATEHVIGCVLCSPGCFSLFRGSALMEDSVMKKYTTKSSEALHYVQYDQGEDRWLCTLLLKQKFRVEYSAASDAYTHAPEGFNEFYNQRRRWVPSTMANIMDLLIDAKQICKANSSISMPYIAYQLMLMVGTILGPGTIFLMMVGALVSVFRIDIWTSFLWNFLPLLIFMVLCYFAKQKYQLMAAFFITAIYAMVMMAVVVGIIIQVLEDGVLSPSSLFFIAVIVQIIVTALMHPQEFGAVKHGIVYYITIPSMYMLLIIYSLFNMNDVSWGTRENPQPAQAEATAAAAAASGGGAASAKELTKAQRLMRFLGTESKEEEDGAIEFSFAGLFRCMWCTHPRDKSEQVHLLQIADQLKEINGRLNSLEGQIMGRADVGVVAGRMSTMSMHNKSTNDIIDLSSTLASDSPEPAKDFETLFEEDHENEIDELKEEIKEAQKKNPDWLLDPDLKNGDRDTLTFSETKFWNDLIDKYLKPLELSEGDKKKIADNLINLRDMCIMAFIMINALFVLVIFLLQLNKEQLHIKWPVQAKNTIFYVADNLEVRIEREYLELEPLGILFVVFFGIVLAVQFVSMLKHRFGTISEILAAVTLDWYCNKKPEQISAESDLKGHAVALARKWQRPQKQCDDEEENQAAENPMQRRSTVHKLIKQHKNKQDWSNLEVNFKRRYLKDGDLETGRITLRRETVKFLEGRRDTLRKERIMRKSMQMGFRDPNRVGGPAMLINNDGIHESNVDDFLDLDRHNSTVIWAQNQTNSINYMTNRYPGADDGGGNGEAIMPAWNSNQYAMTPSPVPHHRRRQQQQRQLHDRLGSDDDDEDGEEIVVVGTGRPKNNTLPMGGGGSGGGGSHDNPSFVYDDNNVFTMGSPTSPGSSSGGDGRRRKSEKVVTFDPDNFFD